MSTAAAAEMKLTDPIVRYMRTDFARLRAGATVGEALAEMRQTPPKGQILYFYVLDNEERLVGVVPTRKLLLSPLEQPLGGIAVTDVISIPETATVIDACEFFTFHRLLAFPVVDARGRMLGVVDVHLYTDELVNIDRRDASDELFQLIGVHVADSKTTSATNAFQRRFPWLGANMAGGVAAAFLSGRYEAELGKVVALALFIPVVLALAESVSIQSVSMALQSLRGSRPTLATISAKLRLEAATGVMLGFASGLVIGLIALLWLGEWRVAACLVGGIAGGVTFAAIIGAAIPYMLRFLRREPQVAAGPISLALTDMATLTLYFTIARRLFS